MNQEQASNLNKIMRDESKSRSLGQTTNLVEFCLKNGYTLVVHSYEMGRQLKLQYPDLKYTTPNANMTTANEKYVLDNCMQFKLATECAFLYEELSHTQAQRTLDKLQLEEQVESLKKLEADLRVERGVNQGLEEILNQKNEEIITLKAKVAAYRIVLEDDGK